MLDVTVVFKNSSQPLWFEAESVTLWVATQESVDAGEADAIGELTGYEIQGPQVAAIFINIKEVAGITVLNRDEG